MTAEGNRVAEFGKLEDGLKQASPWYTWGPYVSERQWGTVREDYSEDGDAWNYLPFDHARSRAYRWGEDGLAGFSDVHQNLCVALALWNGKDAFLKERPFGLTGPTADPQVTSMEVGARYATGKKGTYSPVESFLYTRPIVYYATIVFVLLVFAGSLYYGLRRWRAKRRGK